MIEININNLAAVPSVVFGILGLAIFINLFGMPRSIPLVGGMVLALMTLPTINFHVGERTIDGALVVDLEKLSTLPLATDGKKLSAWHTLGARLMIGMVAFIVDIPGGVID